jgi:hypothetical protein
MTLYRYVIMDEQDYEAEAIMFEEYTEAKEEADRLFTGSGKHFAVVEHVYVFGDSELAYTTDGSDIWPPEENDELLN